MKKATFAALFVVGIFAADALNSRLTALAAAGGAQNPTGELVSRDALRVCANPSNLPYSDKAGGGFENKIAELFARRLNRRLEYAWYPATIGFVRNTLRARRCDLIIGVTGEHELVQNTNPYYRAGWVLARRADDRRINNLDDLEGGGKIGAIAQTPPVSALAGRGLLPQIVSYRLRADTRAEHPARQMLQDLAAGEIDAALAYGPIAGYWATRLPTPLTLIPLDEPRMIFRITMGVRRGEPEWKKTINDLIADNRAEIDAILREYNIPLIE